MVSWGFSLRATYHSGVRILCVTTPHNAPTLQRLYVVVFTLCLISLLPCPIGSDNTLHLATSENLIVLSYSDTQIIHHASFWEFACILPTGSSTDIAIINTDMVVIALTC